MTVSNPGYLKSFSDATRAMGRKAINSDFTVEIEGYEGMYLLTKQCPWPVITTGGKLKSLHH